VTEKDAAKNNEPKNNCCHPHWAQFNLNFSAPIIVSRIEEENRIDVVIPFFKGAVFNTLAIYSERGKLLFKDSELLSGKKKIIFSKEQFDDLCGEYIGQKLVFKIYEQGINSKILGIFSAFIEMPTEDFLQISFSSNTFLYRYDLHLEEDIPDFICK
jgi:hypothetical protein